jgi:hypothetical protein
MTGVCSLYEDRWLGTRALKDQYPNLYNIVRKKSVTVATVFSSRPLNVSSRRNLVTENLHSWHSLVLRIANIHLSEQHDKFKWSLKSDGRFTVSSMYQALQHSNIVPYSYL